MNTMRMRLLYLMVVCTLGPLAAQSDCKVFLDTSTKLLNTPAHMTVTGTVGSLTTNSEMIYATGNIYMKIEGKWSLAGTTKEMEQLQEKNRKSGKASKATCRYLKDELVNGELAAVYSMSDEPLIHSQLWVSKLRGLPLRQEDDIASGNFKTHNSVHYDYANIRPPI